MIKGLTLVFWNGEQRRLRTFWRLMLHTLIFAMLALGMGILITLAGKLLSFGALGLLTIPLSLIVMLGSVWLAGRFLDRRRFSDFGVHVDRDWWIDLGFGLALGAVLMALIFLVELLAGWITITETMEFPSPDLPFGAAILFRVFVFISVGISEELLSRGYHLKNLAEGLGFIRRIGPKGAVVVATVLSSTVFGLLHAANPNATVISTFNIVLAGILLALGYILTGELAIPIGLHITWNFFQGNVFGFPVSGTDAGATFIAIEQGGDALVTGGAFGPEAGLVGIGAMMLGCVLIVLWARTRYGSASIREALATPELLPRD